jgi:predicted RNase H-like HicB family nuclease
MTVAEKAKVNEPLRLYVSGHSDTGEWSVSVLDLIGCSTVASSEQEALAKVPRIIDEYRDFLRRHGGSVDICDFALVEPVIAERVVVADEGLFQRERQETSIEEIERTVELLSWTRADLLALLADAPEEAFVWDPPYKRYSSWAEWRTIEEVLAHIAICETRYYLRGIGYNPGPPPPTPEPIEPGSRSWYAALGGHWRALLERTRQETIAFLRQVARSSDRKRIHQEPGNNWSLRKVLNRLVSHERLHTKNIRRILRDFSSLAAGH